MSQLPLPVIDLTPLSGLHADIADTKRLATQLGRAFEAEGFAYLVNVPLTLSHDDIFDLAKTFFQLPQPEKLRLAKRTFQRNNSNTYRG